MSVDRPGSLDALEGEGFFTLSAGAMDLGELDAPWAFAERLVGSAPRMVERQIIRAVEHGRSFASTNVDTPLHNDLQLHLGRPPDLQVMVCRRPAERGGDSVVLDMWPVLEALAERDEALFGALFDTPRQLPFVAGTLTSPTIALFGDRLAFVHSPRALPDDPLADRVLAIVRGASPRRVKLRAGEVLVVDNHRALHGRHSFEGFDRELVRLLVWTRLSRPVPAALVRRATLARAAPNLPSFDESAEDELALVMKMLAGASPGALAARSGLAEPVLYELRDVVTRAAMAAIASRRRS